MLSFVFVFPIIYVFGLLMKIFFGMIAGNKLKEKEKKYNIVIDRSGYDIIATLYYRRCFPSLIFKLPQLLSH